MGWVLVSGHASPLVAVVLGHFAIQFARSSFGYGYVPEGTVTPSQRECAPAPVLLYWSGGRPPGNAPKVVKDIRHETTLRAYVQGRYDCNLERVEFVEGFIFAD